MASARRLLALAPSGLAAFALRREAAAAAYRTLSRDLPTVPLASADDVSPAAGLASRTVERLVDLAGTGV